MGPIIWFPSGGTSPDCSKQPKLSCRRVFPPEEAAAQPSLYRVAQTAETQNGRVEKRTLIVREVTPAQFGLAGAAQLGLLIRERAEKGKTTLLRHHLVTSRPAEHLSAEKMLAARRDHWGIEGKCHQRLDISCLEDKLHVRSASAAATLGLLSRISVALFIAWSKAPGRRQRDRTYPVWSKRQIRSPSALLKQLQQPLAGDG